MPSPQTSVSRVPSSPNGRPPQRQRDSSVQIVTSTSPHLPANLYNDVHGPVHVTTKLTSARPPPAKRDTFERALVLICVGVTAFALGKDIPMTPGLMIVIACSAIGLLLCAMLFKYGRAVATFVHPSSESVYTALARHSVTLLSTYCGAVCAGMIAAALTLAGSTSMSPMLEAAIACGALGSLFAVAACAYGQHTRARARYCIWLGMLCSAIGTVLVVAAGWPRWARVSGSY
ncbi:hypothetical protein PENSPDRAFT_320497 [Peniophora sp. CONT]|nr:hypothetical protein PENSPDRAFT_320497 [Peniophora sp. CONT]